MKAHMRSGRKGRGRNAENGGRNCRRQGQARQQNRTTGHNNT
ncbi:MAG: hypothetical protein U9N19_05960 [Thermodesulfobacteriota bacterium]|nr:hypothetical protein [Thermodesulfobacteriota bacterium]